MNELEIYCINLEKRSDRWQSFLSSTESAGVPTPSLKRWSAKEELVFGHLGCLKSHIQVLTYFLVNSSHRYCVIFEDDFEFLEPFNRVINTIEATRKTNYQWDVLLLQGYYTKAYPKDEIGLAKIFESCATGGYIVERRYCSRLLAAFLSSVVPLEQFIHHPQRNLIAAPLLADQVWKQLQMRDNWFIFSPPIGRQHITYSDCDGSTPDHIEQFRYKG